MRPLSFLKQHFLYLISPYLVLKTLLISAIQSRDRNPLRKDCEPSGKKVLAVIPDMNLAAIKKYKAKLGCTINDYCVGLLSVSLHEYFTNEKNKPGRENLKIYDMPDHVTLGVPFSMR